MQGIKPMMNRKVTNAERSKVNTAAHSCKSMDQTLLALLHNSFSHCKTHICWILQLQFIYWLLLRGVTATYRNGHFHQRLGSGEWRKVRGGRRKEPRPRGSLGIDQKLTVWHCRPWALPPRNFWENKFATVAISLSYLRSRHFEYIGSFYCV